MRQLKAFENNKGICVALILFAIYVLYWWLNAPRILTALFLVPVVALLLFMVLVSFNKVKIKEEGLFLFLLIASGLLFCFAFPPMKVPDESYHYISTFWIADALTGNGSLASSDVLLRADDWLLHSQLNSATVSSNDYLTVVNGFSLFCTDSSSRLVSAYSFTLGAVNPTAKIPTVIALLLAKALNLGAYPTFYLGRLFSLAFFVACAYLAFRVAPKGKSLIVFVSLLPMTLHLAASYSYDCGIIAYSLLIFAFLMRGFFGEDGSIGTKGVVLYCLVSALLAPCKVIYCLISFLGLLVPSSKFSETKLSRISKAALLVASVAVIGLIRLSSIAELATGSEVSQRGTETGHFYTLSQIVSNPVQSFRMLLATLDVLGDFYWASMLGSTLGWLQEELVMPYFIMLPYLGMGVLCCFESKDEDARLPRRDAVIFVLAFALISFAAILSMWTGHTFDTETVVMGVQGRYFLPALPILLFALRSSHLTFKGNVTQTVLCGVGIMNLLYLVRLLSIVASL